MRKRSQKSDSTPAARSSVLYARVSSKEQEKEGYRKTNGKVQTAVVHKILTNPLYYGDFEWDGQYYKGVHEPIVSKQLWEKVQDVLSDKGKRKTKQQKHYWTFRGLISCGHCGCALVAERKKRIYIYYHCTGYKGKCPEKYVREEEIARQFGEALRAISLDGEAMDWIVAALKESHSDEKRYHDDAIATLQDQYQRIQNRLDAMYVDKLDGRVPQDLYDRKNEEWRKEQLDILRRIETHQKANTSYVDQGVRILELAKEAHLLYQRVEMAEKRTLLNFVFSNSEWKDGELIAKYRKPFETLAKMKVMSQEMVGSDGGFGAKNEKWLGNQFIAKSDEHAFARNQANPPSEGLRDEDVVSSPSRRFVGNQFIAKSDEHAFARNQANSPSEGFRDEDMVSSPSRRFVAIPSTSKLGEHTYASIWY